MKKFLLLSSYLFITSLFAEAVTGNLLFSQLNSDNEIEQAYALGFIGGISDHLNQNKIICLAENVNQGKVNDIVKHYLLNNPEIRHYAAPIIINHILVESFPCK